jgi:hypothetical protein
MISEILPLTAKVTAFPTSGGFSHIHVISPLLMRFPKNAKPVSVSTNAPQYKATRTLPLLSPPKQQ